MPRFSAFRSMIFHSRPVHSLMLSSHRFLYLPLRLPPRLSYRGETKRQTEEMKPKSGLALNGISYYGKPRTARSGGSCCKNLQWCPRGQPDYGIDKKMSTREKAPRVQSWVRYSRGGTLTTEMKAGRDLPLRLVEV